jgi:hypothetical protein
MHIGQTANHGRPWLLKHPAKACIREEAVLARALAVPVHRYRHPYQFLAIRWHVPGPIAHSGHM